MPIEQNAQEGYLDLSVERTQLLERDAEWAAAASEGRDIERVLSGLDRGCGGPAAWYAACNWQGRIARLLTSQHADPWIPDQLDIDGGHFFTGSKPCLHV